MHKTIIAVYEQQAQAIETVEALKANGFSKKNITILGKLDADDEMGSKTMSTATKGVGATLAISAATGALAGVGLIAIPGLGFLYGAGALVGAIVGFDFGALASGVVANLLLDGEKSRITDAYDEELRAGNTLVVVRLSPDSADRAMELVKANANYKDLQMH